MTGVSRRSINQGQGTESPQAEVWGQLSERRKRRQQQKVEAWAHGSLHGMPEVDAMAAGTLLGWTCGASPSLQVHYIYGKLPQWGVPLPSCLCCWCLTWLQTMRCPAAMGVQLAKCMHASARWRYGGRAYPTQMRWYVHTSSSRLRRSWSMTAGYLRAKVAMDILAHIPATPQAL